MELKQPLSPTNYKVFVGVTLVSLYFLSEAYVLYYQTEDASNILLYKGYTHLYAYLKPHGILLPSPVDVVEYSDTICDIFAWLFAFLAISMIGSLTSFAWPLMVVYILHQTLYLS